MTPDNVTRVGKAFRDSADEWRERLADYRRRLVVEPALGDPASRDMARELNRRLTEAPDSVLGRLGDYVAELAAVADSCERLARDYQIVDAETAGTIVSTARAGGHDE